MTERGRRELIIALAMISALCNCVSGEEFLKATDFNVLDRPASTMMSDYLTALVDEQFAKRAALLAEANRKAAVRRGEADAEATRIYAEAFSKDPAFYEFIRSLRAYREIIGEGSTLIVPSDSPLLKVLRDPEKYIRSPGSPQ